MTAVSDFLASHRDWASWLRRRIAVQQYPSNTNIRFRYRTSKSRSFGVIRSRVFQLPVTSLATSRSGTPSLLRARRNYYTLYNVTCLAIVNKIYNFTFKIRIPIRVNVNAIVTLHTIMASDLLNDTWNACMHRPNYGESRAHKPTRTRVHAWFSVRRLIFVRRERCDYIPTPVNFL